jgi:hypothetical protein
MNESRVSVVVLEIPNGIVANCGLCAVASVAAGTTAAG